jgi:hypothetical protein
MHAEFQNRRYSSHGFVQASPFPAAVPKLSDPHVGLASSNDDFEDPDDPWDIEMDESVDEEGFSHQSEHGLSDMLERNTSRNIDSVKARASAALQAAYQPFSISPLRDERNERVFCHFVEITSRCMTIFERQTKLSRTRPPQTIWNLTLPSKAMGNHALAHAMLALGGLHIAKLRNTSEDPSLKHFTYALRRVGKLLGLPKRRHEISTLATVLLLGFYEVMSADHSRWNLHLEGARKLIMEHDVAGTMRTARRMRHRAKQRIDQFGQQLPPTEVDYIKVAGVPASLLNDEDWELDQQLIANLTGLPIDYDSQCQPNFSKSTSRADLTEKDVSDYRMVLDLRWW